MSDIIIKVTISGTSVKMAALAGKVTIFGASASLVTSRYTKKMYPDEAAASYEIGRMPYSWPDDHYVVIQCAKAMNLTDALKTAACNMEYSWKKCRQMIKNSPAGSSMEMSVADMAQMDCRMQSLGAEVCAAVSEFIAGNFSQPAKPGTEWTKTDISAMSDNELNALIRESQKYNQGEAFNYGDCEWKFVTDKAEMFLYARKRGSAVQPAAAPQVEEVVQKIRKTVQMAMITAQDAPAGFVSKCLYRINDSNSRVLDGIRYIPLVSSLGDVRYVNEAKVRVVDVFVEPPTQEAAVAE